MQQWTVAKAWQTKDINTTNDPQKKYRLGMVSKNILLEGLNRFHVSHIKLHITPLCSLLYTLLKDKYMCLQDKWKL